MSFTKRLNIQESALSMIGPSQSGTRKTAVRLHDALAGRLHEEQATGSMSCPFTRTRSPDQSVIVAMGKFTPVQTE
jgi:hypothetical protein